jgi:hypothetical protein
MRPGALPAETLKASRKAQKIRRLKIVSREKQWYKIFLDNGLEVRLIATVKSKGLCYLTINYLRTVYPEERKFKLWFE